MNSRNRCLSLVYIAELEIQARKMSPHEYAEYRERFLENIRDEAAKEEVRLLGDAELLRRAQQSFERFLDEAHEIWDSDIPLGEQWKHLDLLIKRYAQRSNQGDPIRLLGDLLSTARDFHEAQINHAAISNALISAIEIYCVRAKTGQLPETLPEGLPKDPYNGRAFEYEITETGFLLRCPDIPPELGWSEGHRDFKFKVTIDD